MPEETKIDDNTLEITVPESKRRLDKRQLVFQRESLVRKRDDAIAGIAVIDRQLNILKG